MCELPEIEETASGMRDDRAEREEGRGWSRRVLEACLTGGSCDTPRGGSGMPGASLRLEERVSLALYGRAQVCVTEQGARSGGRSTYESEGRAGLGGREERGRFSLVVLALSGWALASSAFWPTGLRRRGRESGTRPAFSPGEYSWNIGVKWGAGGGLRSRRCPGGPPE